MIRRSADTGKSHQNFKRRRITNMALVSENNFSGRLSDFYKTVFEVDYKLPFYGSLKQDSFQQTRSSKKYAEDSFKRKDIYFGKGGRKKQ